MSRLKERLLPLTAGDELADVRLGTCWQLSFFSVMGYFGFGLYLISTVDLLMADKVLIGFVTCLGITTLFHPCLCSPKTSSRFLILNVVIAGLLGMANLIYICIRTASFSQISNWNVVYVVAFYIIAFVPITGNVFRDMNVLVSDFADVNSGDALIRLFMAHKYPDGCLVAGLFIQIVFSGIQTYFSLHYKFKKDLLILEPNSTTAQHEALNHAWKEWIEFTYPLSLIDIVLCIILFEVSNDQTFMSVKITAYIRLVCTVMHLFLVYTGAV